MAVSCSEVMYGAYYPYLYGRGAARSFHHAPHFQYDRLNVQSGASNASSEVYGGAGGGGGGVGGVSTGSASSGAQSPGSPPHAHLSQHAAHAAHAAHARLRAKEEDLSAHGRASADGVSSESEGECGGAGAAAGGGGATRARAQYVSANCVVFTHYSGDVATVVDEHFARALSLDKSKECVPMVSRNLPASFFNAAALGTGGGGGGGGGVELYEYDPWHQHYGGYGHAHRHAAEYHSMAAHHSMAAAGYGPLLLGRGALHPAQYKPVDWAPQHPHAAHHAHHAHPLDAAACSPYSYAPVPGLEAQVQDTSKDLYWF